MQEQKRMKMEQGYNTDICVIGGGPAGSSISKRLAELGHRVIVLEKEVFPRPHVGICLSNETDVLLDYLGVRKAVEAAAFAKRKSTVIKWSREQPMVTEQPGSHVDRGCFDQILLQNAVNSGVQLLQPARSHSITHKQDGEWQIKANYKGKVITITAQFLVDTSGRSRALVGKRIRYTPVLFALHATWKLKSVPHYDGFMEAGKDAWLWAARLNNNQAMISFYTDPTALSSKGTQNLKKLYLKNLENFSLIKLLERDTLISEVHGCDANSRYTTNPVGVDFIRVGDANFTVDPMASQGVHLAISSAIQAAIVVNTLINYPEHAEAAQTFYQNRQQERVQQFQEKTVTEYSKAAQRLPFPFWQKRGQEIITQTPTINDTVPLTTTLEFCVCNKVEIKEIPVMKDKWIEQALAVHHPSLNRPVAFLGGKNLVLLFDYFKGKQTILEAVERWNGLVSKQLGFQIIHWLWERRILTPCV